MIKFVYFDVGGVVIHDFSKTNKWEVMRRDIGVTKKNETSFIKFWNESEGKCSIDYAVDNLLPIFTQKFNLTFPEGYSMLEDFANRIEQNTSIWPLIQSIHKTMRVGLLTNMYVGMFSKIEEKNLLPHENWDVIVDSSKVGYRKPQKEIYKIAQEKAKVKNEEILFVDNLLENLEIPKRLGWKTFQYDPGNTEESNKELGKLFNHVRLL